MNLLKLLRLGRPFSSLPQRPTRGRRPRQSLSLEALEDRVVPAQYVDLGGLRFWGDFTQVGDDYQATGAVQLGLASAMKDSLTPLVDIVTNARGSVTFTKGTPDPTFTVTNAAVTAAQGMQGLPLWQTTSAAKFDVASLISGGVALPLGGQPFAVAGGLFTLDNLAFFNPGDADTGDAQVRLQGDLTVAPLTGLTLDVGGTDFVTIDQMGVNLTGVSGPVSGSLSLGGLGFDPAGLHAAYDRGGEQFVLSGKSSFQLEGNAVLVTFANPGLVVADGVVQQVGLTLAGDLTLGGLTFSTGGLTVTYTGGNQTYTVTGQSTVTIDGQPLTVALVPGLTITNGALTKLDMTGQGILMLQDLAVRAGDPVEPLKIAYTPRSGEYTLTGPIVIETLFDTAATLGANGQDVLKVRDGSFVFEEFNLQLSNANLGAFTITTLVVSFTPDSFTATLDLTFPNNWVVGGTVGFLDGKLNTIGLELQTGTGGIPIPDTGVTIIGFSGEVQNLQNPSDLIVSGHLTAVWGTQQIMTMTGGFTVSKDELVLDASVGFVDGLATGTGTLTLDWGQDNYELEVNAVWLDGLLTFDAVIDLSDGDDLYVKAEADLNVPQVIPIIGGDRLTSIDFVLEYHGGQPLSDSFVAAWVDFAGIFEIGVKVDFAGNHSVIGSSQIDQIDSGPPTHPTSQVYHYDILYTVPQDATLANLQVTWPDVGGNQSVAIVIPDGPTIDQSQFSAANGYSLVPQFTSRQAIMVGVVNPDGPYVALPPGNYTLRLISNRQFHTPPRLTALYGYARPTIAVGELPAFPGAGTVTVPLSGKVVTAQGANARATLFFDSAGAGYHGTPIAGASNLPVTVDAQGNWTVSGTWSLDGLLPLPYYVYAAINDGVNGTVYSAYSSAVTPTPALSGTVTNPTNNDAALSGMMVYVDANHNGKFDVATDPSTITGPTGFYAFAASQLPSNTSFFVGVVIPPGFRLHPGTANPVRTTYDGNPLAVNFQLDEFTAIHGTVYSDLAAGRVGQSGWTVFLDANGNGALDAGEVSTLSAADGLYAFHNVPLNSTQTVHVELRESYYQTAPAAPGTYTVEVGDEPFRIYDNNDFGVLPFSTVSGTVTGHLLNHGVLEPNAAPLQGWTVHLLQNGSVVATTATDRRGNYTFGGLRTGTYAVQEVVPSGWRQIEPFTGKLQLGDPAGSHTYPLPALPLQLAVDVVVADFDHNGKLDTAVFGSTFPLPDFSANVWVYYNGDFTNPVSLNPGGPTSVDSWPVRIVAAWVVGGGGPDLVVLYHDGTVTLLPNQGGALQNGSPNWTLPNQGGLTTYPDLVQGDFFVSVNGGEQLAAVYVDSYHGTHGIVTFYEAGTPFVATSAPGTNPTNLAAGDINGDGITDLFLGSGDGSPVVYYGNGDGGFTSTTITSLPAASTQIPGIVVLGDINGDGLLDVGIFDQNSLFHYALQDASGSFTQSFSPGVGVSGAVVNAAVLQDVNGDFRPDLVWTVLDVSGSNPLVVALNTGTPNGLFAPAQQTRWPLNTPNVAIGDLLPFATGDLDGDGLNDLVVLDASRSLVQVVVNESTVAAGPIPLRIQGGQNPNLHFVNAQLGQVNGRVFDDLSRDGHTFLSKPGRAGVTVYVDQDGNGRLDEGEPSAVTVTQGAYAFADLPAGTYQVRWLDEPGRRPTTPDGGVYEVDLSGARTTLIGLDFGNAVRIDHVLTIPHDTGTGDWTVVLNRGRLEVLDRDLGVVDSQPLADLHSLTVHGADGQPNRLTLNLTAGGFFHLPGGVRFVGGTSQDDILRVLLGSADDVVTVEGAMANVNNRLSVSWVNQGGLTIHTGAGNDTVIVTGTPLARGGVTTLNGGDGNDVLLAGDGNHVLLGGAGDDVLLAGTGRNLLIGGEGSDALFSRNRSLRSGSILIGGSTAHDANDQALRALLSEWSSCRSLPTRIDNLTDGGGSKRRRNGDSVLNADTLVDDGVADLLFGDSRQDWFLPFPGDRVVDRNPWR